MIQAMCYSAMVEQGLKNLGIRFKARVDYSLFEDLFRKRAEGEKIGVARALERNFASPTDPTEKKIREHILRFTTEQVTSFERELFTQKTRLADAERKLSAKPTKSAQKEKEVAERQIDRYRKRLERLHSKTPSENDSRIYAFDYAPLLLLEDGELKIVPLRYHLRPQGASEDFDRKFSGCYNARRDNLTGFWKRQFGAKHAALIISGFFENVKRHDYEKRALSKGEEEENLVLHFRPEGHEHMIVPCLWDEWSLKGSPTLRSFALITDEPPPEVLETGHDRCPVFLKEGNLASWLDPKGASQKALFELLDDKEKPLYRHGLAITA